MVKRAAAVLIGHHESNPFTGIDDQEGIRAIVTFPPTRRFAFSA